MTCVIVKHGRFEQISSKPSKHYATIFDRYELLCVWAKKRDV